MKKKQVLSMALVMAMSVGLLAGCGDNPSESGSEPKSSEQENSQQESSAQPESSGQEESGGSPEANGGGSSTSLLEIDSLENPNIIVDLYWAPDAFEQAAIERYEEKYGAGTVTVNAIGWNQGINKLNEEISAGEVSSLIFTEGNACFPKYAVDGYFQPIDEYIAADLGSEWMDEASMNSFLYCDKHYVFTNASKTKPYLIAFDKTIFEDNALETPLELQEKGLWTWDKIIEYVDLLTADTDGDGAIDQWGLGPRYKLGNFAYAAGVQGVQEVGNGLLKSNWDDENMLKYFAFVTSLETIQARSKDADGNVVNNGWLGAGGAMYNEAPVIDNIQKKDEEGSIIGSNENIDFTCMPTMDGSMATTPVWDNGYAIPQGAANPLGGAVLAAMILDEINNSWRAQMATYMTEEQIERYYQYMSNIVPQRKNNNIYDGVTMDLGEGDAKNGDDPATIVERYKDRGNGQVTMYNNKINAILGNN